MSNAIKDDNAKTFIPKGFGFYIRPYQGKRSSVLNKPCKKEIDKQIQFRQVVGRYSSCLHDFSGSMMSLLRYTKQVGDVAKNTQNARRIELYNAIRGVVNGSKKKRGMPFYELVIGLVGDPKSGDTDSGDVPVIEKSFPIWDVDQARMISELDDAIGVAPKIVCETVLQQIVNRWESHLANIIRIKYSSDDSLLTIPIELTLDQIRSCGEMDLVKHLFIDKIIACAMKGGTEDHLRFFKEDKGFRINFQDCFPFLNILKEVMFHRDVVVHCDGIASQRHCERMRGICKADKMPKVGERVRTDLQYVFGAWDVVYAAGCVFSYLVCMKFVDSINSKGLAGSFGRELTEVSFEALKEGRWNAVQMMLEPLLKCENKMDVETRLVLMVNLALAYKYSGQKKQYEAIINDSDWDSREENYRAVIATLRGDFKTAYKLIQKMCKEDPAYLNSVYEWVAYADLRDDKNFADQMEKIKASKSYMPHKGSYPVLEFNAPPEDVGKHLKSLFDSLLGENYESTDVHETGRK